MPQRRFLTRYGTCSEAAVYTKEVRMKIPHVIAACSLGLALSAPTVSAWAMDQSPDAPPDSTAAGAPSSQGHTALPSGMAAGTSVNHDTVKQDTTTFIVETAQDNAAELAAA